MTFFTAQFFIQLTTSFIATIAFAILLRISRKHLLHVGVCGTITFAIYYTLYFFTSSLFVAAFGSAMVTSICAEILARLRHAPTIVFVLTGIVPTVPGGALYRAMRDLLLQKGAEALKNFTETLEVGIGIAGGIVTVPIILGIIIDARAARKKKKADKQS